MPKRTRTIYSLKLLSNTSTQAYTIPVPINLVPIAQEAYFPSSQHSGIHNAFLSRTNVYESQTISRFTARSYYTTGISCVHDTTRAPVAVVPAVLGCW